MATKPPYECETSEEVFNSLEPLIKELPDDIRTNLEHELISHGINGESLIFFDNSYLKELNITNTSHQNIIIKAINTLYETKIFANYIATFPSFKSGMIDQMIIDNEINLEILKNEGHDIQFYKMNNINNEQLIQEFMTTFEMIFSHKITMESKAMESKAMKSRNSITRQSNTTLPKLNMASTANLNQMKQSIEQYTSILDKLRDSNDVNEIMSLIKPLKGLDADKLKSEMYAIPATQMLHKIMFHETSIAKKRDNNGEENDDEDDVLNAEQKKLTYTKRTASVLNYIATNKITSSLGTSLLCNEGVTLKELQIHLKQLSLNNQVSLNSVTNIADSQQLLNICHKIHKSYRSTSVETIAFMVIDVDSFYIINDKYDRNIGDELLRQIGELLFDTVQDIYSKNISSSNDIINTFKCCEFYHGDNNRFYVLISVSSSQQAMNYGSIIVNMMRNKTFSINGNNIKRTVCVSVYLYNPRLGVNNIKSNAHIPLFYAKHHGKNQVISYRKVKKLQNKSIIGDVTTRSNIWSKQLYDMIGVYGKYSYNLCKVMTKRFINNKGCNINWKNKKDGNNTILMYCLENRCCELVQFYLKNFVNKLDFNVIRDDGSNALLLAIKYDFNKQIVEKIMWKTDTKNRNITNKWNDNTVQLAQIKGLHQIINSLKS